MLLIELAYAIGLTSFGLFGGSWLLRHALTQVNQNHKEMLQVQQILAQLDDLTSRVVTDVHAHCTRVKEINDELTSQGAPNSEAVLATVAKLIAVNQHMQHPPARRHRTGRFQPSAERVRLRRQFPAALAPPQLRHAHAPARRGHPHHPDPAGTFQPAIHGDLHPPDRAVARPTPQLLGQTTEGLFEGRRPRHG